jgi:hypothetical protein
MAVARTSTYESVLRGIANLGGVKRQQLLSDVASLLFEYVNQRLRQGWEFSFWPEWTIVEQRYFREGLWSAGTYNFGDIVYYSTDEVYYEMTTAGTTTETPSSTATDWTEAGSFDRYVSYAQTGGSNTTDSTEIDLVKEIYDQDPRTNQLVGPIHKKFTNNGVGPVSDTPDTIFIEFRERISDMSGMTEWDATETYAVGEWVYYQGSTTPLAGEAYKILVATAAGEDPQDTPASFAKFNFPYILADFVKRGALSDWLAAGGGGSALGDAPSTIALTSFNEKRAIERLEDEAMKTWSQQGNTTNYTLRTI